LQLWLVVVEGLAQALQGALLYKLASQCLHFLASPRRIGLFL
jgi:hypothetical protein